jgi:hypothetical protein
MTTPALGPKDLAIDVSDIAPPVPLMRQLTKSVGSNNAVLAHQNPPNRPINVVMIGTGEYTTGYVHGQASDSDKSAGVVALTMFDLRRRGKVGRLGLVGVSGSKFPGIRNHLQR